MSFPQPQCPKVQLESIHETTTDNDNEESANPTIPKIQSSSSAFRSRSSSALFSYSDTILNALKTRDILSQEMVILFK